MRNSNVLTANEFTRGDIETVLDHAADLEAANCRATDRHPGMILGLLFFEPSTRTRMSFDSAMKRLGGDTVDLGAVEASSVSKGESLADTIRVIAGYSDAIVLRHPSEGAAKMASQFVDIPVINAGDGAGHHPTQTLLDLYTIRKNSGLDDLSIGIMGDLKYGRTVHSLAIALTEFDTTQHFISPKSLQLPTGVRYDLHQAGAKVQEHTSLDSVLPELDVLYVTRLQRERFPDESEYRSVAGAYGIDASTLKRAKSTLKILHPLPRVDEISADVDATDHAVYFAQAHNGIPVRMALLDLVL